MQYVMLVIDFNGKSRHHTSLYQPSVNIDHHVTYVLLLKSVADIVSIPGLIWL